MVAVWPGHFVSQVDLRYLRERATSLESIAAIAPGWTFALTGAGDPGRIAVNRVSGNLFEVLGTRPYLDPFLDEVLEGVHATLRQLTSALERNKVLEISPPPGTKFDPRQHQAISVVPAEQEPNTVVAVLQKGYLISDRVLRPALVTVAGNPPS